MAGNLGLVHDRGLVQTLSENSASDGPLGSLVIASFFILVWFPMCTLCNGVDMADRSV